MPSVARAFTWMVLYATVPDERGTPQASNWTDAELLNWVGDNAPPSRADGLIPWLWREAMRAWGLKKDSTQASTGDEVRQRVLQRNASLKLIRDWFITTRPDIMRFSAPEALQQAQQWETSMEVKRNKRALSQALTVFPRVYLKGPWGEWRLREPHSSPLEPVQAVGKMLGHCYQWNNYARQYADGGRMFVLFGPDGWPRVTLTLRENGEFRELKGKQNELIKPEHKDAPAAVELLKKLYGKNTAAWMGDAAVLYPWPINKMKLLEMNSDWLEELAEGEGVLAGWANAVKLLQEGPGSSRDLDMPHGLDPHDLEWDLYNAWPSGKDYPVLDWRKHYRIPKDSSPLFTQIRLQLDNINEVEWEVQDYVLGGVKDANKEKWKELKKPLGGGEGLREQLYEWAGVFFDPNSRSPMKRTRYYQVTDIWNGDGGLDIIASIDVRRTLREAKTPVDVTNTLELALSHMKAIKEYWYGDGGYSMEQYFAVDRAFDYLYLKHVKKDEAAAAAFRANFEARHPKPKPLGRMNRRQPTRSKAPLFRRAR